MQKQRKTKLKSLFLPNWVIIFAKLRVALQLETVQYFMDGKIKHALANILLSNVLTLVCVVLGFWLSKPLSR